MATGELRARGGRYWKSTKGEKKKAKQSPLCILERMRDFILLLLVCCWWTKVWRSFHIITLKTESLHRYMRRYIRKFKKGGWGEKLILRTMKDSYELNKPQGKAQLSCCLRQKTKQMILQSRNVPHIQVLFQEGQGELPRSLQFALQTHF